MSETGAQERAWRDLRFRTRVLVAIFLLYLPVMAFAIWILDRLSPGLGNRCGFWLFLAWAVLIAVVAFYQIAFRCPRCGGWFGSSNTWQNPFARRCLHCGEPRYDRPATH